MCIFVSTIKINVMNKNRLRKKPLSVRQRLAHVNYFKKFIHEMNERWGFNYASLFTKYDPFYRADFKNVDMSPCSMLKKILTPKNQD